MPAVEQYFALELLLSVPYQLVDEILAAYAFQLVANDLVIFLFVPEEEKVLLLFFLRRFGCKNRLQRIRM